MADFQEDTSPLYIIRGQEPDRPRSTRRMKEALQRQISATTNSPESSISAYWLLQACVISFSKEGGNGKIESFETLSTVSQGAAASADEQNTPLAIVQRSRESRIKANCSQIVTRRGGL
ncbi:hypothetical protein Bbelb_172400 [Branchiostoma belcheri]|nr:hypothetical protein Bbelb_172400 [Branchiostoma belcheri]